eukprot:Em0011g187a
METASVTAALVTKVTQDTPVVAPPPSYNVSSRERSNATARIGTYCEECKVTVILARCWPIPVGIVLGIIVVEFLEYKQWEKSLREETNRSGSNPLFVDPTSSYSNPRYNARS